MPAEKVLAPSGAQEGRRTDGVREVVRLLVKAQKARRLYEGRNAVSDRLERELCERLSRHVSEEGEIHLVVQETRLKSEDDVVYENPERSQDSLSFLLYRDGIRGLSFGAGLEIEELVAFLECLNRVGAVSNEQDDLVTLLWELDLSAIRYFAIEELSGDDSYARLQDQLSSGEAGGEGCAAAEAVSLDLDQPVTSIPVEACRLEPSDIEELRRELACEERAPFRQVVAEIALELALLEDGEAEHEELRRNLVQICDRLVDEGAVSEIVGLHEHVEGLAAMVFHDEPAVQALSSELGRALVEPARLERFLARVESVREPRPDALTVFLCRLGPAARPSLVRWMGRFSSPAYRRAVTNTLLFAEDGGLAALASNLPLGMLPSDPPERLEHRQLAREIVYAIGRHPAHEAIPLLEKLLGAADLETRRESFIALTRYSGERVVELAVEALADADVEVRSAALDALVRRAGPEHPDLGQRILERSLGPQFEDRSLPEKRRLFTAVAKLWGESALDSFRALLLGREDRWFASEKDRHFAEAVAHGIRMVGTARAREILEECGQRGPRFARGACLRELEARRAGR